MVAQSLTGLNERVAAIHVGERQAHCIHSSGKSKTSVDTYSANIPESDSHFVSSFRLAYLPSFQC